MQTYHILFVFRQCLIYAGPLLSETLSNLLMDKTDFVHFCWTQIICQDIDAPTPCITMTGMYDNGNLNSISKYQTLSKTKGFYRGNGNFSMLQLYLTLNKIIREN